MALPIKPTPILEGDEAYEFEKRAIENEQKEHTNPKLKEELALFYDILSNSSDEFWG